VLGPAHYLPLTGPTLPLADAFDTPLGAVAVDQASRDVLLREVGAVAADRPHAPEHSLEVQLPFLLRVLPAGWTLVPILIDAVRSEAVPDLLDAVVDAHTVVVCSTDLSHYLTHEQAVERDRRTAEAIIARDASAIGSRDACGSAPLRGLLQWALQRDLDVELLDLRTSGDAAGDRSRVVGYGAFALTRG
jgi:AmmeMemoRadiSam system protein B